MPLVVEDSADLQQTLQTIGRVQQNLSDLYFGTGQPLKAIELHKLGYQLAKRELRAQIACTVVRQVSGAYAAARKHRKRVLRPLQFNKPEAMFLIGKAKRDAALRKDGTISIWTVNGRRRVRFFVPDEFAAILKEARTHDVLCLRRNRHGKLIASLSVTLNDVPQASPGKPVGVDIGDANTLVAVDSDGRAIRVAGAVNRTMRTIADKSTRRLLNKLSTKKAEGADSHSVRRALKRLGRKQHRRMRDICHSAAKVLVNWAGPQSVLVLEDLRCKPPSKRRDHDESKPRHFEQLRHAIEEKASALGSTVVYVNPQFTSRTCSRCGGRGNRKRQQFACSFCRFEAHADKNAAINIRNRFTVFRTVGCRQPAPKPN